MPSGLGHTYAKILNTPHYIRSSGWKQTMMRSKTLGFRRFARMNFIRLQATTTSPQVKVVDVENFNSPFSVAKIGTFFQEMPKLANVYTSDIFLTSYLRRVLPNQQVYSEITADLERLGNRIVTEIDDLGLQCEQNPPFVRQYNAYGHRIDELVTCNAWKEQKKVSAEEGMIATAYERKHREFSRLHQMVKLYLYCPSSGLYSCPLAMTDGAAKIAEVLGHPGPLKQAYGNLTSRDPNTFWTSGQWMTERKGGSDVANGTETLAVPQKDGTYKLYGYKWFSSATDSDMTITLARTVGLDGNTVKGTRGLSMFYLETRDRCGNLNNIQIVRLKDKLGTRQLPTAELLLDGVVAHKISEEGKGVAGITEMLKLTRIHNAISSAGGMRRMLQLSRDFSTKRKAFGKLTQDHSLHIRTLANMEVETRGATLLSLELARLLGKEDCSMATSQESAIFRLLTPIAKLYTAKQAMSVVSEGLECFGGLGYLEDTDLPRMLRDAQVLPIWEGTTNILALDVLRALAKSQGSVLSAFHTDVMMKLSEANSNPRLEKCTTKLTHALGNIITFASQNTEKLEIAARDFAYSLARTYIGALLVEHANWSGATDEDIFTANRWCDKELDLLMKRNECGHYETDVNSLDFKLVFDGYDRTSKL